MDEKIQNVRLKANLKSQTKKLHEAASQAVLAEMLHPTESG
jgi:hypothetical protein